MPRHQEYSVAAADERRFGGSSDVGNHPVSPESYDETGRLERWVAENSTWIALGIIVVGCAIRVAYSASCYLNPDEAFGFLAARPRSWFEAYRASHALTHPPMFILVLHWMIYFFGRAELVLRLPSIAGGTAALWLAFAWIRRSLGHLPALGGIIFMAISPAAISGSTEVRQYGLLLCFLCGALYATERAFNERSTRWAIVNGFSLLGALTTHYIALVPIAALGVYVFLRCRNDHAPRRTLLAFASTQLALAAVFGVLYFRQIRHSETFSSGGLSYLNRYFFVAGRDTPLTYTWRAFLDTFNYMVGAATHPLAYISILVFLAGLLALLSGRAKSGRLTALLIFSVVVVGFTSCLAHVFPFAGTRHQAYLLPFLAAGFSAALLWIPRRLATILLLLEVALVPFWALSTAPDNDPQVRSINDMKAAMDYLNRTVPPGAPLFVDEETRLELSYYLGKDDASLDSYYRQLGNEQLLKGHRIVSQKEYLFSFSPGETLATANQAARGIGASPGSPMWIISVRWPGTVPLASLLPTADIQNAKSFGAISLIEAACK